MAIEFKEYEGNKPKLINLVKENKKEEQKEKDAKKENEEKEQD